MPPALSSRRRLVATATVLALCASVAACQTAGERLAEAAGGPPSGSATATASVAKVTVVPASGAVDVEPDVPVMVTATNGQLSRVELVGPAGPVEGVLGADRSTWSSTGSLALGTAYTLEATVVDPYGFVATANSTFTTLTPADENRLDVSMSPLEGWTVGVGMPVVLYMSDPVEEEYRAAVESQLGVTSVPPAEGAWRWINAEELHWRPRELWPAGAQVTVDLDVEGVRAGAALWGGSQDGSLRKEGHFSITAKATTSVVDLAAKNLKVYQDAALIRTIPITGGKPGWETRNGVKVILEKEEHTVMDAATVGIEPGDPDYYRLDVDFALRVTWSGEFLHSAPWSVGQQGEALVSHGCVGMSEADAAWLYGVSTIGDVVTVTGSPKPLEKGNGYTDWNYTWDEWLAPE